MLKKSLLKLVGKYVQMTYETALMETLKGILKYDKKERTFSVSCDPLPDGDPDQRIECGGVFAAQVVDCWETSVYSKVRDPADVIENVWQDSGTGFQNYKKRRKKPRKEARENGKRF